MPTAQHLAPPPQPLSTTDAAPSGLDFQRSQALVDVVRKALPQLMSMYVFGSRAAGAAGAARPDSDLDLAVLVPGYAETLQLWDLSHQLADVAGCPVDLLDLRAASTVMQHQVLTHGTRLWAQGLEADLFECFVMKEKLLLDEARAGILADIAESGRVYGR